MLSSTCFEQPSVHLQEDLYMQLYGVISCIVHQKQPDIDQTAYINA